MTKLLSNITQTIKEKRLLFMAGNTPAPMPEKQQNVNKDLVGEGKKTELTKSTADWTKVEAETGSFMAKAKDWSDPKAHSKEFVAQVVKAVGDLKKGYDKIEWGNITDADVVTFKGRIMQITAQLENQAQLEAAIKAKKTAIEKSSAADKTKFVEEFTKGMTLPEAKTAEFKAAIEGAVKKAIEGSDKTITGYLDSLSKEKDAAGALAKANAVQDTLLENLTVDSAIPELQTLAKEQEVYKQSLIAIFAGKDGLNTLLEGKDLKDKAKFKKTNEALDAATAEFTKLSGDPAKVKDQQKVIEKVKTAQTNIILNYVLESMTAENKTKLAGYLKIPEKNLTVDKIKGFLETYESGAFEKAAGSKQEAVKIILEGIQGLDATVVMEGGADAQAYQIEDSKKSNYGALSKSGIELLVHGLKAQLTPEQIADITRFAGKSDDDALSFLKALTGADRARFVGAGGVLNILLSFSRLKDMGGNYVTDTSPTGPKGGFSFDLNASTKGTQDKQRYSKFSIVSSKVGGGTGPRPAGSLATGPAGSPVQIEAANLVREKAALEAKKLEIKDTTIKQVETTIKEVEDNVTVSTNSRIVLQIKATRNKITEINAKIIEAETGFDSTGIKLKADSLLTQAAELIAEETKLKEIRDALSRAVITAPTGAPGSTGELFDGTKFKVDTAGKYLIEGNDHPLTKEEFDIITGYNRPTETYKKEKTKLTYVKAGIEPTISYDPATKVISGEYSDGTNKLQVTYDIKTGKRKVTLTTGSLRHLLPTDDIAASKRAVIEAALMDGVSLTGLNVVADPDAAETAAKDLKEHLIAGRYHEALKLLIIETPLKYDLITKCVENLIAEISNGTVDSTPLKPMLEEIISRYNQPITVDVYTEVFKKINGGDLTGALAEQLAAHKKLDKAVLVELIKAPGTPLNAESAAIAALYIEKNFTVAPEVDNPTNIKAINAYTGKIKVDAVIAFIIANYAENFDTPVFKPRLQDVLKEADKAAPTANYKALFEKLYPGALEITQQLTTASPDGVGTPEEGAKVWAKYLKAKSVTDLMTTGLGNLFTAGSQEAVVFVDTLLDTYSGTTLGTVNAGNKIEAQNILARISKSTNPKAVQLTAELIVAIKALGPVDPAVTAIEAQEQGRVDGVFAVAMGTSTPAASYENQAAAIKMFIGTGVYAAKDVTGTPQGPVREAALKGKLAELHFAKGKYAEIVTDGVKDNLVVPEQKEFMKYFDAPATLDETGMKYLVDNKDKITPKAIYALAEKVTDNSQKLRLYRAIGLEEKAAEVLSGVTDPAEKKLLQAQMDLINKRYKEMTPAEQVKVKAELIKAYKAIAAAVAAVPGTPPTPGSGAVPATSGTPGTSDSIRMRIVEQLFELSEHISTGAERDKFQAKEILDLLDTDVLDSSGFGHLNMLADKPLSATSPLTDSDILILRAKELRALIELTKLKDDPSCGGTYCNIDHIVIDLNAYNTALGTNPIEVKYADQLLDLYKLRPENLTKKAEFGRIMLQAAKQTNDEKYLVERDASGAITKKYVEEADLTTDKEKTDYYTVMKNFLKAADLETDNAKKIALIKQAPVTNSTEQIKVAEAYEKVPTEEAQVEAVKIYFALGATTDATKYAKAIEILKVTTGSKAISQGRAETLIGTMPKQQMTIDLATERGFKKLAFKVFKESTAGSTVDITMLEGPNKPTDDEIIDALVVDNKKVTGNTGLKTTLLAYLKTLSKYTTHANRAKVDANLA